MGSVHSPLTRRVDQAARACVRVCVCVCVQLQDAIERTYVVGCQSQSDINRLLLSLGRIRSLLGVQVDPAEELLLKNCLW